MINGIVFTIGAIIVITSRVAYAMSKYDNGGIDKGMLFVSIVLDVIGTAMVVVSLLKHNGII